MVLESSRKSNRLDFTFGLSHCPSSSVQVQVPLASSSRHLGAPPLPGWPSHSLYGSRSLVASSPQHRPCRHPSCLCCPSCSHCPSHPCCPSCTRLPPVVTTPCCRCVSSPCLIVDTLAFCVAAAATSHPLRCHHCHSSPSSRRMASPVVVTAAAFPPSLPCHVTAACRHLLLCHCLPPLPLSLPRRITAASCRPSSVVASSPPPPPPPHSAALPYVVGGFAWLRLSAPNPLAYRHCHGPPSFTMRGLVTCVKGEPRRWMRGMP